LRKPHVKGASTNTARTSRAKIRKKKFKTDRKDLENRRAIPARFTLA
jgi:hypothetical protein